MVPVVQLSIPMVPPDVWAHYAGVPPPKPPFPPTPPPVLAPTPPPLQEVPAPPRVIAPRVIPPPQRHPAAAAVPPPRVIPPPATPIIPRQAAPPAQADHDRRVHGRRFRVFRPDRQVAAVDSAAGLQDSPWDDYSDDSPYDMDRDADAFGEDAADDDELEEHADDDEELQGHADVEHADDDADEHQGDADMLHRLTTPLDVQRAQGPVRFLDAYNSDEFAQRQQRPPKKRSLTPPRWQEDDEDGDDPPDAGYPPQQLFQDPDHPLSTVWKRQKRNTIAAAISCQCYPAGAAPPSVPRPPSNPPPTVSAGIMCTRRFADDAVPHGASEVLAIRRKNNHVWEFPKGRRLSKTESVVRTAIREFREETGIQAPYRPSELGYRTPPDTRTRRWWSGSGYTWKRT